MSNKKLVSVIITTKNEEANIENCLSSIKSQSYRDIEIIVVDNNSTDKTKKIVENLRLKTKDLRISIYNKGPERSAQRNLGAKEAKGDYLFFLDADMILDKNVIDECMKTIQSLAVGGIIVPEKSIGESFWGKVKAYERSFYVGDDSIEAARFFEKSIFWEVDGYNEDITGPEDWDMSQKVKDKYKLGRIKNFILHNEGKAVLFDYIKKKYYYGKGSAIYIKNSSLKLTGRQVIYFLRPAFYKNWRKLIKRPDLTCGIIILLFTEQIAGFWGFLQGQLKYK